MLSLILVILVANILYGIGSADQNEETLNFDAMTLKDTVTLQDPGIMPSYYISDSDHKGDVIMYTRGADSIIRLKQRTHQVKRRTSPTNINYLVTTDDKEYIVAVENSYLHNILQLLNKDMDVVDEYRPGSEEEWKAWQYLAYVSPHRFMVLEESDTYYQGQSTTSKANIKTISVVNQSLIVECDVEIDFGENGMAYNGMAVSSDGQTVYLVSYKELFQIDLTTKLYSRYYLPAIVTDPNPDDILPWFISSVTRVGNSLLVGDGRGYLHQFDMDCEFQKTLVNISPGRWVKGVTERRGKLFIATNEDKVYIYQ